MDPTPFLVFERAQELMDLDFALSYEDALTIAKQQVNA
jgi:hypothetical protein